MSKNFKKSGVIAALFLCAAVVFPQSAGPAALATEIKSLEDSITRPGISAAEKRAAHRSLGQLRELTGDFEGAASHWLQAATADPANTDLFALLSCAYCLVAIGEWDRAQAALNPMLKNSHTPADIMLYARFLEACIKTWTGDSAALVAMANDDAFYTLRNEIFYILWRTSADNTLTEYWKNRLLIEFPRSIEARIVAAESGQSGLPLASWDITAKTSPLWLLFPGRGAVTIAPQATPPAVAPPAETPSAPAPAPVLAAPGVRLQTGLFSRSENAQNQVEALRRKGFTASIERRTVQGSEYYAVIVAGSDGTKTGRDLAAAGFESFPLK